VSAANSGDVRGVTRRCEPIVYGRPDSTALHGLLSRTMVAGDQQDEALAARDGLRESAVDRGPSRVEVHSVQVDGALRLKTPASQLLVPGSIEGVPPGEREGCSPRR
jgi:hypothetical protein